MNTKPLDLVHLNNSLRNSVTLISYQSNFYPRRVPSGNKVSLSLPQLLRIHLPTKLHETINCLVPHFCQYIPILIRGAESQPRCYLGINIHLVSF